MLATPIGRLRLVGMLEGVSFILLLGIAMPLKYFAGHPLPVKVVGWAHGLLFLLYCAALLQVWRGQPWSFGRATVAFVAALLPFGPFLLDRRIRDEWSEPG
ncbi:MAG: DUF3817 domain-containing protein [Polyangiales bacterium]